MCGSQGLCLGGISFYYYFDFIILLLLFLIVIPFFNKRLYKLYSTDKYEVYFEGLPLGMLPFICCFSQYMCLIEVELSQCIPSHQSVAVVDINVHLTPGSSDNLRAHSWSYECLSATCPGFDVLQWLLVSHSHLPQVYGALAALLLRKKTSHTAERQVRGREVPGEQAHTLDTCVCWSVLYS